MKLIILLIYTHLVYTELHTFTTTYTGVTGIERIPEFFAITTLDDQQMDYYDSITQKLIPKQKWLEEFTSTELWKEDIEIRRQVQKIYKSNIYELMSRFNQSGGIHTYQRMYGCSWDSETNESNGFDMYGYDGDDFIMLDLNSGRYNTSFPQAVNTVQNWNERLEETMLITYLQYECLYWLKHFLNLAKKTFNSTVLPEVSLQQKTPESPVVCHATGFYPKNATITWWKNGQPFNKSNAVKLGEHLPNGDGTFQMDATLYEIPENWEKDQYVCVVEHKSWTEKIQKILTKEKNSNNTAVYIVLVLVFVLAGFVILLGCLYKKRNSSKSKKRTRSSLV